MTDISFTWDPVKPSSQKQQKLIDGSKFEIGWPYFHQKEHIPYITFELLDYKEDIELKVDIIIDTDQVITGEIFKFTKTKPKKKQFLMMDKKEKHTIDIYIKNMNPRSNEQEKAKQTPNTSTKTQTRSIQPSNPAQSNTPYQQTTMDQLTQKIKSQLNDTLNKNIHTETNNGPISNKEMKKETSSLAKVPQNKITADLTKNDQKSSGASMDTTISKGIEIPPKDHQKINLSKNDQNTSKNYDDQTVTFRPKQAKITDIEPDDSKESLDDYSTVVANKNNLAAKKSCASYVGLQNQGATCYMNSFIQVLFHLPFFRKLLFELSPEDPSIDGLKQLFIQMQTATDKVDTSDLIRALGWTEENALQQQDAQEFFILIIDRVEKCIKDQNKRQMVNSWFNGKTSSSIFTLRTRKTINTQDTFSTLTLDVKNSPDLKSALNKFLSEEKLTGDNRYMIDGKLEEVKIRTKFVELPPILQIQLLRYNINMFTKMEYKIDTPFEFTPSITIPLESGEKVEYDLYSVIVHFGTILGGHFFSYLKPDNNNDWYEFNDSSVRKVEDLDEIFGDAEHGPRRNTYILMYVRKDKLQDIFCPIDNVPTPQRVNTPTSSQVFDITPPKNTDSSPLATTKAKVTPKRVKSETIPQPKPIIDPNEKMMQLTIVTEDALKVNSYRGVLAFECPDYIKVNKLIKVPETYCGDNLIEYIADQLNMDKDEIRLFKIENQKLTGVLDKNIQAKDIKGNKVFLQKKEKGDEYELDSKRINCFTFIYCPKTFPFMFYYRLIPFPYTRDDNFYESLAFELNCGFNTYPYNGSTYSGHMSNLQFVILEIREGNPDVKKFFDEQLFKQFNVFKSYIYLMNNKFYTLTNFIRTANDTKEYLVKDLTDDSDFIHVEVPKSTSFSDFTKYFRLLTGRVDGDLSFYQKAANCDAIVKSPMNYYYIPDSISSFYCYPSKGDLIEIKVYDELTYTKSVYVDKSKFKPTDYNYISKFGDFRYVCKNRFSDGKYDFDYIRADKHEYEIAIFVNITVNYASSEPFIIEGKNKKYDDIISIIMQRAPYGTPTVMCGRDIFTTQTQIKNNMILSVDFKII